MSAPGAMASSEPAVIGDAAALAELELILRDAYGVIGGQQELNDVVEPAVGIRVWDVLGSEYSPMKVLIHNLRAELVARGPDDFRACLEALYVSMPGNMALRAWMTRHMAASAGQVPAADFLREQAPYAESHRTGERQLAISGLETLQESRRQVFIEEEIARFRGDLDEAARQLHRVNAYWALHDILQDLQLQTVVPLTWLLSRALPDDHQRNEIRMLHGSISVLEQRARSVVDSMLDGEAADAEGRWLSELRDAIRPLREMRDQPLRVVLVDLRGILRSHMPRLNWLITDAASRVPFRELSRLLRDAAERAPEESPLPGRLEDAADALDRMGAWLERLIHVREQLQDVESALAAMEVYVRYTDDPKVWYETLATWRRVREEVVPLLQASPESDARVHDAVTRVEQALDARESGELALAFEQFTRLVRLESFRTDAELRSQAASVARLDPTLSALVEEAV